MVFVIYIYFIRDVITRIPQAPEPDLQYPDVSSLCGVRRIILALLKALGLSEKTRWLLND